MRVQNFLNSAKNFIISANLAIEKIANCMGANFDNIIITSGGTEGNNIVLQSQNWEFIITSFKTY